MTLGNPISDFFCFLVVFFIDSFSHSAFEKKQYEFFLARNEEGERSAGDIFRTRPIVHRLVSSRLPNASQSVGS